MTEQQQNLKRVSARIAGIIMAFCRELYAKSAPPMVPAEFHMIELLDAVNTNMGVYVAPDSPSRILRQLRAQGRLDYVVVSRASSLYQITALQGTP